MSDGGAKRRRRSGTVTTGPRLAAVALAFAVAAPAEARAEEPAARTLAVFPIKLLDTSAEPADQRAAHDRRLVAMAAELASDLEKPDAFGATALVGPDQVSAACPSETPECLIGLARNRGARFALFGVVHKSSTLIMQLFARFVSIEDGRVVLTRDLNFRGDTDESWRRAREFLAGQIRSAAPE